MACPDGLPNKNKKEKFKLRNDDCNRHTENVYWQLFRHLMIQEKPKAERILTTFQICFLNIIFLAD